MTAPRQTDPPPPLEIIGAYPGVVTVAGFRNLGICTWRAQAVGPAVDLLFETTAKLSTRAPRTSFVHLIRDKLALPDGAARRGFVRLMEQYKGQLACVAVVVGGSGFWASAMRNAVIGLRVLAPRGFDFRLHGSIDEVVNWLPSAHEQQTGIALPARTLRQLLVQAEGLDADQAEQRPSARLRKLP